VSSYDTWYSSALTNISTQECSIVLRGGCLLKLSIGCPYPWVLGGHGCDVIVHGWALFLCILASNSKSESNFSDAKNTLVKKRSGLKPVTVNDFLFVRSNQDLVQSGNTHYTIFKYTGAIWIAWVGIGRCWWLWSGYGHKLEGKCWALMSMLHNDVQVD
jgi:hypothetical protein